MACCSFFSSCFFIFYLFLGSRYDAFAYVRLTIDVTTFEPIEDCFCCLTIPAFKNHTWFLNSEWMLYHLQERNISRLQHYLSHVDALANFIRKDTTSSDDPSR